MAPPRRDEFQPEQNIRNDILRITENPIGAPIQKFNVERRLKMRSVILSMHFEKSRCYIRNGFHDKLMNHKIFNVCSYLSMSF